jgi:HD-GYP domain-containing protein (c-di-GMP phosphodiesterase class II)
MLGEQLRQSYLESTRALVAAVEARDPYTHDHSQRVGHYAKTIAIRLNLSQREISRIETAAILHDIGKIGIPDSILRKTEKLLPDEFDVIRGHPSIGVKILGHTTYLRRELPIILHHHEQFDGSGYPDGLVGEKIPIGARVLAAADALDAMLSRRAYRPALTMREARGELERHRGTQFDPTVVDVLLDWLDEMDGDAIGKSN